MKPYLTLSSEGNFELTEKRSLFIGKAIPVSTEDEALSFVAAVRKKYPDARHTVYAFSLFNDNVYSKKFSDDGEPQGTAGKPVLDILDKQEITNACITVTRYFGGILLGAPGLLRAYTSAAAGAVSAAGTKTRHLCRKAEITVPYNLYGTLERIALSKGLPSAPPVFTDNVSCEFTVKDSEAEDFVKTITDTFSGTVSVRISDPFYCDYK